MAARAHPSRKRYPPELRARAVRLVQEAIAETGERQGVVGRIARQLGIGVEILRTRVKRAEIDGGRSASAHPRAGPTVPARRRGGRAAAGVAPAAGGQ